MSNSSIFTSNLMLSAAQIRMRASAVSDLFGSSDTSFSLPQQDSNDIFSAMLSTAKGTAALAANNPQLTEQQNPFGPSRENVSTAINRLEIILKAQHTELGSLKDILANEQESAQQLVRIDTQTSAADIKQALHEFIDRYNAGVNRFAPDVAHGGILEYSAEAARARFATQRDINNPLVGADGGLKGGMTALGITVDPKTGLAAIDETKLNAMLSKDGQADVNTIHDFANQFIATITNINAEHNPQDKQLNNLERAIQWIADNKGSVQKEFGLGKPATPNSTYAKAAAAYQSFSML
jgi:flagellar capping protein FliD